MRLIKAVILIAVVATLARHVLSWVPTGETWPSPTATFRVNAAFPAASGTFDEHVNSITSAAAIWHHQARTPFAFEYLGETSSTSSDPFDGENVVRFSPASGGGGVLAVTIRGVTGSTMEGFDVVFFGENDMGPIDWSGVGDPTVGEEDIAATAAHEFGHALGLDHTPSLTATMFANSGGVELRTLNSDDIAGAQALYGFDPTIPEGPVINDVTPASGDSNGGYPVIITGDGFTWSADTELRIAGAALDPSLFVVESPSRIRIFVVPPHLPGPVPIQIINELGLVTLDAAFTYIGPAVTTAGVLSMTQRIALPGDEGVPIDMMAAIDFDLGGYSFAVSFDPAQVSIDFVSVSETDAASAEFVGPAYDNVSGWWSLSVAIDVSPPVTGFIPASDTAHLARAFFEVSPTAATGYVPLTIQSGFGSPPADVLLSEFGTGLTFSPTTLEGGILVVDGPLFIRGDSNRNQTVDVADAVFHLEWLFLGGPTFCFDAQDCNDDGSADISDAIHLLSYLFVAGAAPFPPFPFVGVDSTLDTLGCSF